MPVNVSHSSNPALKAQLAFTAGQGEYNKWKRQYEDRAEQQALNNAFKLSGEMRQAQAPFVQAKLQNWSDQQRSQIELKQVKALTNWRSSKEYADMEAAARYNKAVAVEEAGAEFMSGQTAKLLPNIMPGAVGIGPDGKEFRSTGEGGILDQKATQAAVDRMYRQKGSIDPSGSRPSFANQFESIPFGDKIIVVNKNTGQHEIIDSTATREAQQINSAATKSYGAYTTAYSKATDDLIESEMDSLDEQALQHKWKPETIKKEKRAARNEIYAERDRRMKDYRFFADQIADANSWDRLSGGRAAADGQRVIPEPGEEGSSERVDERQGAGGIDPYFGRSREEQEGIASGALTVGRGEIPEVGEGDPRSGEVPPSHVELEARSAEADIQTLTTGLKGIGEIVMDIQEVMGTDWSEGGKVEDWDPSMSNDQLTDSMMTSVQVKKDLRALNQYMVSLKMVGGIKGNSVLAGVKRKLTRINAEMDKEIAAILPLLASAKGAEGPEGHKEAVVERLQLLGKKFSHGESGWLAQMQEAWAPAEWHLDEAMSRMTAEESMTMGAYLPRIFHPGLKPDLAASPRQMAGGIRNVGDPSDTALRKFYNALNNPPPVDATLYTSRERQGYVRRPIREKGIEGIQEDLLDPDLLPAQTAASVIGMNIGEWAGYVPEGQVQAQIDQGRSSFPGGKRMIGKEGDLENMLGRKIRQGGDVLEGFGKTAYGWLESMFE